jgi:hypothetical protein
MMGIFWVGLVDGGAEAKGKVSSSGMVNCPPGQKRSDKQLGSGTLAAVVIATTVVEESPPQCVSLNNTDILQSLHYLASPPMTASCNKVTFSQGITGLTSSITYNHHDPE